MARAKRGFKARRRRNRIRAHAKGFRGGRSKLWKAMVDAVHHAWRFATQHRRKRKRDFRE
ncbi:MAG: 50S ribosomal protein L20, partial [Polyangia bacterium]